MAQIKKSDFLKYLYGRLPSVYRVEDAKIGSPLYRFLDSLCSGGTDYIIDFTNSFLNLIDPEKCPEDVLPVLYKSFGLDYFEDISPDYHRRFLKSIGALLKRRGTYTEIRYLVETLTSITRVDLNYYRSYNNEQECTGRHLDIILHASNVREVLNINTGTIAVQNFVKQELPFYITPLVSAEIDNQMLELHDNIVGVISSSEYSQIYPFGSRSYTITIKNSTNCLMGVFRCETLIPANYYH